MVSDATPGVPDEALELDPDVVDDLLDDRIQRNIEELAKPWDTMVDQASDLQAEIDRTVASLGIFFRKWVVELMFVLSRKGTLRFNELKASLDGISSRTLSKRLTELTEQGLVERTLYDEMPVRVEYELTDKGDDVAMLALPMIVYLRLHGPLLEEEADDGS